MRALVANAVKIAVLAFVIFYACQWVGYEMGFRTDVHHYSEVLIFGLFISFGVTALIYLPALVKTGLYYRTRREPPERTTSHLLGLWRDDLKECGKRVDGGLEDTGRVIVLLGKLIGYAIGFAFMAAMLGLILWLTISVVRWMWEHALGS